MEKNTALRVSGHSKERVESQRYREADTSSDGMSEWERLEAYYRYYPVGVIAACCEREDYLKQLESGTLRVVSSALPKRCDYKNYERLMRNARLRGKCLSREKYCPNRSIVLKSIGYKPKKETKKKRCRSPSSESSSVDEREEKLSSMQTRLR